MQEIWLKIWRTLDVITDEDSAKDWISTLARNTAINDRNKNNTKENKEPDMEDDVLLAIASNPAEDPADIIANEENVSYIYQKICKLDKKYADVLLLNYKYSYTPLEIASLLHLNQKTIYSRLSRGKAALKNMLLWEGSETL